MIYRHPMGRFLVIEKSGINMMGDTYCIRTAFLTPKLDARGLLTSADKLTPGTEPKTVRRLVSQEEEKQICLLYQNGVSVRDIARQLNRSQDRIFVVLNKHGMREKKRKGRPWTDAERRTVIRMYYAGASMTEIGKAIDRTRHAVSQEVCAMRTRQEI